MSLELISKLHTNQRMVVTELLRRGAQLIEIFPEIEFVHLEINGRSELLFDRDSSQIPYSSVLAASDKFLSKLLLQRAGINVPIGSQFYPSACADALRYLNYLDSTCCIKPSRGSHGDDFYSDIKDAEDLSAAVDQFTARHGADSPFLIERQIEGDEYRIFINRYDAVAVLNRVPASIIGDGHLSIEELVRIENHRRMNPRLNSLCEIVLDNESARFLKLSGLSFKSIPAISQEVRLRRSSNVAKGGRPVDQTDQIHPRYIEIAKRALSQFPGLPYAGVDIITKSISAFSPDYVVLEVNSNPGVHMHERPAEGKSQPVARYVADMILGENSNV